jgi:Zn-dependent protease/CBS domain-containing protein
VFGRNIKLFKIFGFEVRVNVSWVFLALLIAWSLAVGLFPQLYKGFPATTYWWMAVVGVIGVFFSIIVHELCHSLVARAYGMEMKGITLFLFGGVAEMEKEPPGPVAEFFMALAGPAVSIVIGLSCVWLGRVGVAAHWAAPAVAVISYLGWLNLILAGFNLIPAFPMDGGRMLRAVLWKVKGDLRWATHWASRMGSLFGLLLMGLGVVSIATGGFVGGIWWFLIGMFIRAAAQSSYQQLEMKRLMSGIKVKDIMDPSPPTVTPNLTLDRLVTEEIYPLHQDVFPVVEDGRLLGSINTAQVKAVPREEWDTTTVGRVMTPLTKDMLVDPELDALGALKALQTSSYRALIVAREGRLLGLITLAEVMKFLNLKLDLEAAA